MSDLAAALQIAIRVHAGQVDKQGQPYLLHVLRVVEAVSDEAKVVAALHDVIEDGTLGIFNVAHAVGASRGELAALCSVTRLKGSQYSDYIDRILADEVGLPIAREVKLADLKDHLVTMPDDDAWASLRCRYERALEVLGA